MKIKRVKWRDSQMFIHQEPLGGGEFDVSVIESIGFVIAEDATKIVLAGDLIGDNSDVRRVIVIPKENIEALNQDRKTKRIKQ